MTTETTMTTPTVHAKKLHDNNVCFERQGLGARDAAAAQTRKIAILLLSPRLGNGESASNGWYSMRAATHLDHLARVVLGVAVAESELTRHVLVTVLHAPEG